MKMKDFERFNSGICDICVVDDMSGVNIIRSGIRFLDRVVGAKRFYLAEQSQMVITKIIRIQYDNSIFSGFIIQISGSLYEIIQIQHLHNTMPKTTDLTLSLRAMDDIDV